MPAFILVQGTLKCNPPSMRVMAFCLYASGAVEYKVELEASDSIASK